MSKTNLVKSILFALLISIVFIGCSNDEQSPTNPDNTVVTANDILNEINIARTNPSVYIALLTDMKQYFYGNEYREPGQITIITNEGVNAVNDAISALKNYNPMGALTLSNGLTKACQDHVNDVGSKGIVSHYGSDGSSPGDRMNRYGQWDGSYGECISFGKNTARKIVLQLIIDDGVSSRGHREIIYTASYTKLGAVFGSHAQYKYMCTIDFANSYIDK